KYCGRLKTLVKSHIIPRSFCDTKSFGIYDDELFCKDCEDKFMLYDAYAFQILSEQSSHRKALRDEHGQVLGAYYETYDYTKLKLFFMSVLLRAGLSDVFFFKHVKVGPYLRLLKDAVDAGQAPVANDFAVFLAYYDELKRGPIMFPPAQKRIEKIKFYHFHIGQVIFYIKVDKRDTPAELQPIILQPSGKLFLMKFGLKDSNDFDILQGIERIHHGIE
ncbi:MAG: hypothetical protein MUO24_05100, partial [Desulfobacterales bacterium]|nr:hypothetical protein [Desulfobacterales bacterium]